MGGNALEQSKAALCKKMLVRGKKKRLRGCDSTIELTVWD